MSTATETSPLQSDGEIKEDNTLVPEDWDERLRIARAKREKVLAVKAAASKSSKPKKPANRPTMAFDPAEAMAMNAAYFKDDDDPAEEPVDEPDTVLPAVVPITPLPVEASVTVPSIETLPEIVPQRRLGTAAWVLVACFFGIGVGFALGLGLLIGSGWISPSQLAKPTPAPLNDTTTASLAIVPEPPVPAATLASISVAQPPIAVAPNLSSVAPNLQNLAPSSYGSEMVAQTIMTGPSLASLPRLPSPHQPDAAPSPLAEFTIVNLMNVSGRIPPKLIITDFGEQTVAILPQTHTSTFTPLPMMAALSIPAPAEVAFVRPVNIARPLDLLSAAPDLNTPNPEFGATSLPSIEPYLISFSPVQTSMIAETTVEKLPTADLAPAPYVPPSFAEIMGLSTEQALTYRLALMAPDNVDAQEVANLSDTLGKTGLPLSEPIRVSYKISRAHIRYYSDADRTIAAPLAASLGIEARDFTANNNGANKIEIWMAGTSNKRPRANTSNRRNRAPRVSTRTRLNNSILNGLRKVTN